jgi:hypothetical protein
MWFVAVCVLAQAALLAVKLWVRPDVPWLLALSPAIAVGVLCVIAIALVVYCAWQMARETDWEDE